MILMIDNYDSFTYNIVQYLLELGAEVEVRRNDEITIAEIEQWPRRKLSSLPDPVHPTKQVYHLKR